MSQTPDDPFENLQREVERLFRDMVYKRHPAAHFMDQPWAPATDLLVSEKGARVIVELAGVPRDHVRVRLNGRILEISGRRHSPQEPITAHYHQAEIYFGDFQRLIELPWEADEASVKAYYRDGMLEIRMIPARTPRATEVPIKGPGA